MRICKSLVTQHLWVLFYWAPSPENLAQLIATLREHEFPFRKHARVLHEIQAVLAELRGVKKEIKSLDSVLNIFSSDQDMERTRQLLRLRIKSLLSRLEQIANEGA